MSGGGGHQSEYFVTITLIRDTDKALRHYAEIWVANNRLDALEYALADVKRLEAYQGFDISKTMVRERGNYHA